MIGSLIRAILFDAGNTLIRIDYATIGNELERLGATVSPDRIQRADWLARVKLDVDLIAVAAERPSTEDQSMAGRYFRYVLETLGVTDATTVATLETWRRAYNAPVGFWNVADPEAEAA